MSEELIQKFSLVKKKYYDFQTGEVSVIEFNDILLPFLSKITSDRNYKKILGDTNTSSINLLLINIKDKINAYEYEKDLGNEQAARQEQKDVLYVATRIVNKLEYIIDTMERKENNSNNYGKNVNKLKV